MRTTCRRCADDTRARFRVRFHWRMTYVIHTLSAHCLHIICTSSGSMHVVRTGWQQLCIKPTGFLFWKFDCNWNMQSCRYWCEIRFELTENITYMYAHNKLVNVQLFANSEISFSYSSLNRFKSKILFIQRLSHRKLVHLNMLTLSVYQFHSIWKHMPGLNFLYLLW